MSGSAHGYWESMPLGPSVTRLACDTNGMAALDKPEGVLSHPNSTRDQPRSLLNAHYDTTQECYEWPGAAGQVQRLWLINRLDSATSGVILAATEAELARQVREQFRKRKVHKVYQALVFGKPRHPEELWRDRLDIRKLGGVIRTSAGAGSLPAESSMRLLHTSTAAPRVSLVRLEPHTGRSHQLRVQCAKRGLPIVGDRTYGDFGANRQFAKLYGAKRLFLHSLETSFDYEFGGAVHLFSARSELPSEFSLAD